MPILSLHFDDGPKSLGPTLTRSMNRVGIKVRAAIRTAAQQAADEILVRGRQDISAAGNYSPEWQSGLRADIVGDVDDPFVKVRVTHDKPYYKFLNKGGVIKGNPMLWIPIPGGEAEYGMYARDYPGQLVKVVKKSTGLPLLVDVGLDPAQVVYFGKTQVTMPQKFHIFDIIRDVAKTLGSEGGGEV